MHINFVIRSVVSRGSTVSQNILALFLFFSTTVISYINTIHHLHVSFGLLQQLWPCLWLSHVEPDLFTALSVCYLVFTG